MESRINIITILFALLLTANMAASILLRKEEKEGKPDPGAEELEWITDIGGAGGRDEKVARQVSDSLPNSLCPSGITGQFPFPPDCKRFVNCWKGRGMIQVCAPGTLFNPAIGECDYLDKVKCVRGEASSSGLQPWIARFPVERPPIATNQRYSRRDKEYFGTETVTMRTKPGRPPYVPRPTHPTTPVVKLQQKVECPPGSAGLYPHPTDCTMFLNCWGGRMFIQKCGPGTYFNPDMSVCDHASAINCAHSEPEYNGQGSGNEYLETSQEEGQAVEEDHSANTFLGSEIPSADLHSAGTDLFDVRSGVGEDIPDETEKPASREDEEKTTGDTGKERDPSWGKILNFGNGRDQMTDAKLFHDAQGSAVESNRFLGQNRKQYDHSPRTQQQLNPTYHQPVGTAPRTQHQPQNNLHDYYIPNSRHHSGGLEPQHESGEPRESDIYYLRPHNHVTNQYPPHLQTGWTAKAPFYRNPQSHPQSTKTGSDRDRPPAHNLYYPSSPVHAAIPGHFILVTDKIPVETRVTVTHDRNQNKRVHAPFSIPVQKVWTTAPTKRTDLHFTAVEPSRVLLPPRAGDAIKGQSLESRSPSSDATSADHSGPKPFFGGVNPVDNGSPNTPATTTPHDGVRDQDKEGVNIHRFVPTEKVPVRHWWTPSMQNGVKAIVAASTYRPNTDVWPNYRGNGNPHGVPAATPSPTPAPTATTRGPETATSPSRVHVVYPIEKYENSEESEGGFHGHHSQKAKFDSAMRTQKLKGTASLEKATDEDLKKRIKSEMDFGDSEEDLSARDVEMYAPTTLDELFPNAKKEIRLRPLSSHLDGYIEMKKPNGEWGLVCDRDYGWMINEANVACKELGYGRGAQISWQGYPLDSSSESVPVSVSEITCNGSEHSLKDCRIIYGNHGCDITKNAVGLRCFDNVTTQCHPEEVEYDNNCYRLVKRDDLDDAGLTLEEAAEYCNQIGGRISDVVSEEENDFISRWLMEKHPEVRSVLTGGIGSAVMGRSLWMWFGSHVPMLYQNWWKGWADEKKIKQGTVHEPSCIVLRKSYPCFIQNQDEAQIEVELGNVEPEFCSANYFYWDVEECRKLKELKLPHLCKKPLEEIGCVVGRGEDYSGIASVTSSGRPCLPWDHPEVKAKLAHQITLQEWSTKLSGHNYCRNMGRQELHPWCFVEGKENSEYCSIPQCWNSVPGYSKSAVVSSSCDEETQFECSPGECVKRIRFCDGKKNCRNGRDEAMCDIFLREFARVDGKRMDGRGKVEWPDTNENGCAKLCLENKKFKCKSFSYDKLKRSCFLSETNAGLSGQVVDADGWSYYELMVSSLNCSADRSLAVCKNGKCVNLTNICDGRDNCGDGSDETDCSRIGYEVRLAGSNETNRGRVEVKILGRWGAVCDDKFDLRAGQVVCRELGFKYGVAEILRNVRAAEDDFVFLVDDLECLGNETSIRECKFPGWGMHDCKPEETVGVVCRVAETKCSEDQWSCRRSRECIPIRFLCDSISDCDDGSDEDENMCNEAIKLRLAGGPNATSGRLEIRYLGTWGTICDDNFNDGAATVICRILGYEGPSYAFKNARFGSGSGPIWLDGLRCFGNETDVSECDHSGWGKHNCKHDEDVSVSCSNMSGTRKPWVGKPVATSLDASSELSPLAKVEEALMRECSDQNGMLQSVGDSRETELRARVVGSDVARGGIPWQASVRVRSPGGKSSHWCGAVVISPYHVLTAGHCLRDYSKPAYFIRVGDFDTEVEDPEEQEFAIDHLYIHPEFNRKLHLNNDIALAKVKGEIRFGERVRPACLPPSTDIYQPGTNCSISGWGSISAHSSGYAKTLRRAYVPILEASLCKAPFIYGNSLGEGMFCAGNLDGGVDSCQGDSGGPMVCQREGKQFLYGITSWGHGCGRANKPGVYTNVAYYGQWIQDKILISLS